MRFYCLFIVLFSPVFLAGCSTKSPVPQYINPSIYANHSCQSLESEVARIRKLAKDTENESSSLSLAGVGIGIAGGRHGIYPSISLGIGKNSQNKAKLSALYGEHDAMILSARQKNCTFAQGIRVYGES